MDDPEAPAARRANARLLRRTEALVARAHRKAGLPPVPPPPPPPPPAPRVGQSGRPWEAAKLGTTGRWALLALMECYSKRLGRPVTAPEALAYALARALQDAAAAA